MDIVEECEPIIADSREFNKDIEPLNWISRKSNRFEYTLIYAAILMVTILYLIISATGTETTWYRELMKGPVDPWVIRSFWIVSTILSYVSLLILLPDICIFNNMCDNILSDKVYYARSVAPLFLISLFIALGWMAVFYYVQDIGLSLWLIMILFTYEFWLFIYIWYIKPLAAVFMIPLLILYVYLMYSVIHLAYLNNVIL